MSIKQRLDFAVNERNSSSELSLERPDPLLVARENPDEYSSLVCALFAYGNAKLIVKFLQSIDFSIIDASEEDIRAYFKEHYYRFQTSRDVREFFITLSRLKRRGSLNEIFLSGYSKNHSTLEGISSIVGEMNLVNSYSSRGYKFLIGQPYSKNSSSTYKRWNMYVRWMVRKDWLDLGLWSGVDRAHLLMPLDTHTFNVALKLNLLKRKTYDLKAVIELTNRLREFDADDPIKYDFALYRMGQEGVV